MGRDEVENLLGVFFRVRAADAGSLQITMGSFPSRGRFLVDVVVTFADGAKSSLNSI
jgi:hypothetical protein